MVTEVAEAKAERSHLQAGTGSKEKLEMGCGYLSRN